MHVFISGVLKESLPWSSCHYCDCDFHLTVAHIHSTPTCREIQKKKEKKRKAKDRKKKQAALSFAVDEEDDEGAVDVPSLKKVKRFGKDPNVSTYFLPDKEREEEEKRLREQLQKEFDERQEAIKEEQIEITYSYWDGSGHRRQTTVKKGLRIDQFLEHCRRELCDGFPELRGTSAENLMYIKEDLVIPHVSFFVFFCFFVFLFLLLLFRV